MTVFTGNLIGLALPAEPILPLMTMTGDSLHPVVVTVHATIASVPPFPCVGTIMVITDVALPRVPGWKTFPLRVVPMMIFMTLVLPCRLRVMMTHTCHPGLLDVPALPRGPPNTCPMNAVPTGRCIPLAA